jgi:hypothetical protein
MVRVALVSAALAVALVASVAVAAGSGGGSSAPGPAAHVHPHGSGYDPPPPATPPPPPAAAPVGPRSLVATVGPAFTIRLRRAGGAPLGRLPAGRYTITVDDRAEDHNFHLYGPGVNRRTGVAFVGQTRWTVQFRKGKQYRFRCDPHSFSMKGSFRTR